MQTVVGSLGSALKMVLQVGSWVILGLLAAAKGAAKALDKALPPEEIETGNVKADEGLRVLGQVL